MESPVAAWDQPRDGAGEAGLSAVLDEPGQALLALDYDGTLAPIVEDPGLAFAEPGVVPLLRRLAARLGTVAVLTGRPVAEVRRLAGLDGADGLEGLQLLGQYGVERWDAATGEVVAPDPPEAVAEARAQLPGLLARLGAESVHVEDKGRALGVHVRRTADPQMQYARLQEPLAAFAAEHGLHLEPGKLVLELRAPGMDKGNTLRDLVGERRARAVIYAGDDLGDLAAYDAVDRLRQLRIPGLLLCVGAEQPALADRADLVLDGPAALVSWLGALADRLKA